MRWFKLMKNVLVAGFICSVALGAFAQRLPDEPVDKFVEYDPIRMESSLKLQEVVEVEEQAILVGEIKPLLAALKQRPTLIKVNQIIPDFQVDEALLKKLPDLKLSGTESGMVDGTGPILGNNYIKIYIDSAAAAGSETDYIYMRFGNGYKVKLNGYYGAFPAGYTLTWDLNDISGYVDNIPMDRWDQVSLQTVSSDGILVDRVIIVHSSQEILDWSAGKWLDKWNGTFLGLGAKILERKLDFVSNTDNASVHYGAREIGKTDGDKYGTSGAWCSEFASWCLRKSGVMTPTGSIGTSDMKSWFSARGRLYTQTEIKNKTYVMVEGDYISLFGGDHSAVFYQWVDSTTTITDATRYKTIEGNTGGTVTVRTRNIGDINRVGRTK